MYSINKFLFLSSQLIWISIASASNSNSNPNNHNFLYLPVGFIEQLADNLYSLNDSDAIINDSINEVLGLIDSEGFNLKNIQEDLESGEENSAILETLRGKNLSSEVINHISTVIKSAVANTNNSGFLDNLEVELNKISHPYYEIISNYIIEEDFNLKNIEEDLESGVENSAILEKLNEVEGGDVTDESKNKISNAINSAIKETLVQNRNVILEKKSDVTHNNSQATSTHEAQLIAEYYNSHKSLREHVEKIIKEKNIEGKRKKIIRLCATCLRKLLNRKLTREIYIKHAASIVCYIIALKAKDIEEGTFNFSEAIDSASKVIAGKSNFDGFNLNKGDSMMLSVIVAESLDAVNNLLMYNKPITIYNKCSRLSDEFFRFYFILKYNLDKSSYSRLFNKLIEYALNFNNLSNLKDCIIKQEPLITLLITLLKFTEKIDAPYKLTNIILDSIELINSIDAIKNYNNKRFFKCLSRIESCAQNSIITDTNINNNETKCDNKYPYLDFIKNVLLPNNLYRLFNNGLAVESVGHVNFDWKYDDVHTKVVTPNRKTNTIIVRYPQIPFLNNIGNCFNTQYSNLNKSNKLSMLRLPVDNNNIISTENRIPASCYESSDLFHLTPVFDYSSTHNIFFNSPKGKKENFRMMYSIPFNAYDHLEGLFDYYYATSLYASKSANPLYCSAPFNEILSLVKKLAEDKEFDSIYGQFILPSNSKTHKIIFNIRKIIYQNGLPDYLIIPDTTLIDNILYLVKLYRISYSFLNVEIELFPNKDKINLIVKKIKMSENDFREKLVYKYVKELSLDSANIQEDKSALYQLDFILYELLKVGTKKYPKRLPSLILGHLTQDVSLSFFFKRSTNTSEIPTNLYAFGKLGESSIFAKVCYDRLLSGDYRFNIFSKTKISDTKQHITYSICKEYNSDLAIFALPYSQTISNHLLFFHSTILDNAYQGGSNRYILVSYNEMSSSKETNSVLESVTKFNEEEKRHNMIIDCREKTIYLFNSQPISSIIKTIEFTNVHDFIRKYNFARKNHIRLNKKFDIEILDPKTILQNKLTESQLNTFELVSNAVKELNSAEFNYYGEENNPFFIKFDHEYDARKKDKSAINANNLDPLLIGKHSNGMQPDTNTLDYLKHFFNEITNFIKSNSAIPSDKKNKFIKNYSYSNMVYMIFGVKPPPSCNN